MADVIIAAADGSSLNNPGPSGWAWYIDDDRWAAGGWPQGTNNMGELMAVLDLLRQTAHVEDDLLILCDSQYVINSLTKWMPGWKRRGWRKADGKPVQNVELLQALDGALAGRRVSFDWVKGHAGHDLNEAADLRARAAALAHAEGVGVNAGPGFSPQSPPATSLPVAPTNAGEDELFSTTPQAAEHPVIELTRVWLSDAFRADRDSAAALLHPNFNLHDARGRSWGRGRTLASLAPLENPVTVEVEGIDELAPWVVQLRWRARSAQVVTLRTSIWIKNGDSWRLRFEQQTPAVR